MRTHLLHASVTLSLTTIPLRDRALGGGGKQQCSMPQVTSNIRIYKNTSAWCQQNLLPQPSPSAAIGPKSSQSHNPFGIGEKHQSSPPNRYGTGIPHQTPAPPSLRSLNTPYLARRRLEDARVDPFGKAEHVHRTKE